jgi:hypothetical protein
MKRLWEIVILCSTLTLRLKSSSLIKLSLSQSWERETKHQIIFYGIRVRVAYRIPYDPSGNPKISPRKPRASTASSFTGVTWLWSAALPKANTLR